MSETKPTYENQTALSTQAEATSLPFRRFRTIAARLEEDENSLDTVDTTSDIDMVTPLIDEGEIQAYKLHDGVVHTRYEQAAAVIDGVNHRANDMHTTVMHNVNEHIIDAQKAFEYRCEQIDAQADSMIAAINEKRRRAKARESVEQNGRIAESERLQAASEDLLESNLDAIRILQAEIGSGETFQKQLESRRDNAIEVYNQLVAHKYQRQQEMRVAEDELAHFKGSLFNSEADKDELFDKESELNAAKRSQIELLARPRIQELLNEHAESQESSEGLKGLKEAIQDIKNSVSSAELMGIEGELRICHEKQRHVFESIQNLEDLIEERKHLISTASDEIVELDREIAQVKMTLAGNMNATALEIEKHSTDAVRVAEVFQAIIHGDTTEVARSAVSGPLRHVWKNIRTYQAMMAALGDGRDTIEWEVPDFDMDVLRSLRDDPEDTSTLADEQTRLDTMYRSSELLAARPVQWVGQAIKRSFLSRGVRVAYESNGDTPQ